MLPLTLHLYSLAASAGLIALCRSGGLNCCIEGPSQHSTAPADGVQHSVVELLFVRAIFEAQSRLDSLLVVVVGISGLLELGHRAAKQEVGTLQSYTVNHT